MPIIIIAGIILFCRMFRAANANRKRKELATQQALLREQLEQEKQAQAERKALLRKQRELEREQLRQKQEQARLAKEQERQAAQLAKHEEEIAKLRFRVEQAEANIDFYDERLRNLMARRDNYMAHQAACGSMSAEWDKWQSKIIVLDNQIHTTETKLNGAKFSKEQAENKLSA